MIARPGWVWDSSGSPSPSRLILLFSSGLILGPPLLARMGYKLIDIVAVLAIALLAMAFLLPAMAWTRSRTAGQRTFPMKVPVSYYSFLFGDR